MKETERFVSLLREKAKWIERGSYGEHDDVRRLVSEARAEILNDVADLFEAVFVDAVSADSEEQ